MVCRSQPACPDCRNYSAQHSAETSLQAAFFFFWQGKKNNQQKKLRELLGGKKVQPPVWRSNVLSAGGMRLPGGWPGWAFMVPVSKTAPKAQPCPTRTGLPKWGEPPRTMKQEPGEHGHSGVVTPKALLPWHRLVALCPPSQAPGLGGGGGGGATLLHLH